MNCKVVFKLQNSDLNLCWGSGDFLLFAQGMRKRRSSDEFLEEILIGGFLELAQGNIFDLADPFFGKV